MSELGAVDQDTTVGATADDRSLLRNRSFQGHVGAQFFGAFNDNLFKQLILFLAARELFPGEDKQGVAFGVFALPFILFSGVAGELSERFSKRSIIVLMKLAEILILTAGAAALQTRSWHAMLAVLFVMGVHSAFFGPSKYGVIPEIVGKQRLLSANGIITMTTFLAILLGQATAGPLLDRYGDTLWIAGAWCVAFAAVGNGMALLIRPLPPLRPTLRIGLNPFGGVPRSIRELRADRRVFRMLLLNSLFWFNGGVLQQAIVGLGAPRWLDIPKTENWRLSLLLVVLATAIIVGSVCVAPVARIIRPGKLVAFGAVSMLACQGALTLATSVWGRSSYDAAMAILAVLGFTGAFFAVPVQTFLQDIPEEGTRGKTFAVNNFLNFTFIALAGGLYMVSSKLHVHPGATATLAGAMMCGLLLLFLPSVLSIERPKPRAA